MENGLDPHVWNAASLVIITKIAQHRTGNWSDEISVSDQDAALAGWIIGELHKFGFIKDPNT